VDAHTARTKECNRVTRKGQLEISEVKEDDTYLRLYAKGANHPVELILLSTEDGIRKALIARHKARKATKPPKQYKAEPFLAGTVGTWMVKKIPE